MRIAQIAPLYEAVPPKLYGGTERVVSTLADALVERGHEVTLFASADSRSRARLVPGRAQALRLDPGLGWDLPAHMAMLEEVRRQAHRFDILHFHTDCLQMPLFRDIAGRTVTTMHGRLDLPDLRAFFTHYRHIPLVSISNDQRRPLSFANFVGTVYHGLPRALYPFTARPDGGYLAFLGRISPEKRPDRAIEIAKRAGLPLKIAAKVGQADAAYFNDTIRPLLDHPLIEFVGEINDSQKPGFLGNAAALLFPIDWPEPFGLVMIEAMACGTPVIAWRRGSVPEVIDDGVTGRIVEDLDDAVAAVETASRLDRACIRRVFEERFSVEAMAEGYLRIYRRLLAREAEPIRIRPVELGRRPAARRPARPGASAPAAPAPVAPAAPAPVVAAARALREREPGLPES